jgi:hypothetical protein
MIGPRFAAGSRSGIGGRSPRTGVHGGFTGKEVLILTNLCIRQTPFTADLCLLRENRACGVLMAGDRS